MEVYDHIYDALDAAGVPEENQPTGEEVEIILSALTAHDLDELMVSLERRKQLELLEQRRLGHESP